MTQTTKSDASAKAADTFAPLRAMFMTLPRMQASAIEIMLKQQKEVFEFLAHRCDRDLEFVERLSHIEDVTKLPDVLSKFMQGASRDYAEEARKSVDAGSRAASEFTGQLKDIQAEASRLAA